MKALPKTWKQVCKIKGIPEKAPFGISKIPKAMQAYMIAAYMLPIVIEVLNEGWKPDWKDHTEYKYCPWFEVVNGNSLVYYCYDRWSTDAVAGSRLCFKNSDLAKHAGIHFKKIYEDFMLLPNK